MRAAMTQGPGPRGPPPRPGSGVSTDPAQSELHMMTEVTSFDVKENIK